jgi:desulfoferrodoxin (superoxide reductase-like protein)
LIKNKLFFTKPAILVGCVRKAEIQHYHSKQPKTKPPTNNMKLQPIIGLTMLALARSMEITAAVQTRIETLVSNTSTSGAGPDYFHSATSTAVKHDPFIHVNGTTATVSVRGTGGSTDTLHPQTNAHYISDIWVRNQAGVVVYYHALIGSEPAPTTHFTVPTGTRSLTPMAFCNLHGLWKGPTYDVHTTDAAASEMLVTYADATFDPSGPLSYHVATAVPAKHDPAITIGGGTATVRVLGAGGSAVDLHPQGVGHYISHIYVTDQTGSIVHSAMLTSDASEPMTAFTVVANATELTAHEFCNLHGLWKGKPVCTINGEACNHTNAPPEDPPANVAAPLSECATASIASTLLVCLALF